MNASGMIDEVPQYLETDLLIELRALTDADGSIDLYKFAVSWDRLMEGCRT